MVVGRRWVLTRRFDGAPKESDFELVSEELGDLADGEILYKAEFISADPYQRPRASRMTPPFTMIGRQVAVVVESKNARFPVGSRIFSHEGWVETGKANPDDPKTKGVPPPAPAFDIGDLSPSLLLGSLGFPGATAYFGLLELCQPRSGETVLVNGAAGAVGSLVGQIAKLKGCTVIAYAGSDEKVAWLRDELKFDHVFNYKKISMEESLKIAAPNGVDCFFDNVGGRDTTTVLSRMNERGRVALCGAISTYNDSEPLMVPAFQGTCIFKQIKMEGFIVSRWADRLGESVAQLSQWIREGKIKTRETVVEGFENMPKAFAGLFTGDNIGKMVLKV